MRPLENVRILDFTTLLPGPLATLVLAEAGAEVIKIERPGRGDEMRSYAPKFGSDSINFALLNRGKRSVAIDLKAADAKARLAPLIGDADVVIEQFRPGTLDRLGFGYEDMAVINPGIVYVSLTGWGQNGPLAQVAAHDLNYCAQVGALSLTAGPDGSPVLPNLLMADIAGGTYPAVFNILLALRRRDATGKGLKIDIAMADNLFTTLYWAIGNGTLADQWPRQGAELLTGGSPRYCLYRTADDRFVAAAPLEEKFWSNFCDLLGLAHDERDDEVDPDGVRKRIADAIATESAATWRQRFEGRDLCCNIVATLEEAMADPHFAARRVFSHGLSADGRIVPALPVPIAAAFRTDPAEMTYPPLGHDNDLLIAKRP